MRKIFAILASCLLCASSAVGQSSNPSLMGDADYKVLLTRIEAQLPKWETQLNGINPNKIPEISYANGNSLAEKRDLALVEIGTIRRIIVRQRSKRTVYGELSLKNSLDSLFDLGEEIVWTEDFTHLSLTHLEKDAPELSALTVPLVTDAMERVSLLEKNSCP